ncbi:MAG: flagellar motor switch protein FliN [Pseudomonadota bacterium]
MSDENEQNDNDEVIDNAADTGSDAAATDDGVIADGATPEAAYEPDELGAAQPVPAGADINLDVVLDVPVNVALRVGQASISIRQLVSLVEGSVIELDRESTDPMDVLVNDTLVARGEIVVVDDKFGVRLTDVVSPNDRISTLN